MLADILFVSGIIVAFLAVPSIISAFSRSEPPRAAAVAAAVGGVMVLVALWLHPGGYRIEDLPAVFDRVMKHFVN